MGRKRRNRKGLRKWGPLLTLSLILVAVYLASRVFRQFSFDDVIASVSRLHPENLGWAALFSAGSYLSLSGFDYLGIRYAGRSLSYPRVLLASFVSLAIGHTVGLAPLSSGAIRYRYYTRWGLRGFEISLIVVFSAMTVALGELSVAAIALIVNADLGAQVMRIDAAAARALGIGCATMVAGYLGLVIVRRRFLNVWHWRVPVPSWRLALGQIAIGTLNYMLVVAALHQTLASVRPIDYAALATVYVLANLAALLSHVPGGIGVIEAVIITLLPDANVIGGVIAFRVIYFFVPFAIATLLLVASEIGAWIRRRRPERVRAAPGIDSAA